jgi:hypothetical protein
MPYVFVTANPQPFSNDRRMRAEVPVGGADANPIGFGKVRPATFTERSTSTIGSELELPRITTEYR